MRKSIIAAALCLMMTLCSCAKSGESLSNSDEQTTFSKENEPPKFSLGGEAVLSQSIGITMGTISETVSKYPANSNPLISKAIPHKDCARIAQSDFSSDCTTRTTQGCRLARTNCAI